MARGKIIKGAETSGRSGELSRGILPRSTRILRQHHHQATLDGEAMVAKAREQAEEMLRHAAAQAEEQRVLGRLEAEREAAEILMRARRQADATIEGATNDLQQLAISIARRIIGEELTQSPRQVVAVVCQVLQQAGQSRRYLLRVNPGDLPALEAAADALAASVGHRPVLLEADEAIAEGGCVLETERGQVDGRIETQLENIARVVFSDD